MKNISYKNRFQILLVLLSMSLVGSSQAESLQKMAGEKIESPDQAPHSDSGDSARQLQNYIEKAIANNAGLKASYEVYRAKKVKVRPMGTLPDPQLTYVNFIRAVETRVGPQEHKLGLVQRFPWFGTLSLQSKIAEDDSQTFLFQFEGQRLFLIRDVKHIFYDAYFLGRSIDILDQNLDLIANLERVTRTRYRAGIGLFSDVIRSQVELEKIKDRLETTRDLRTPLIAKFNALLNQPPDTSFIWPKSISSPDTNVDREFLRNILVQSNPALKGLERLIERERKKIQLAQKDGLPSFKLGFDYIFTGESAAAIPESGKDSMAAMVTLDIPLWRGKYRDQVKEARSVELAARKIRQEKLNQLEAELSQAIYQHSDATRKITLYKTNLIPKGRQSFEATKRSYEAGKLSFSDLIDSERLLLEFEIDFEQALTHANKADASIDMLVGHVSGQGKAQQEKK